MQIGDAVTYVDPVGGAHNALITAVWGTPYKREDGTQVGPAINLVWISEEPNEKDPYGGQVKRQPSCVHVEGTSAHGNYWK